MLQFKQNLPENFKQFLVNQIIQDGISIINIRSSSYHPQTGGFRPVEIMIEKNGNEADLYYLTEFQYFGVGTYAELGKSNDFDFLDNRYQSSISYEVMNESHLELFMLITTNLANYIACDSFDEITVTNC